MSWFDRCLNSGDDCPNIQKGFEVGANACFGEIPKCKESFVLQMQMAETQRFGYASLPLFLITVGFFFSYSLGKMKLAFAH
ncbi:hypothetical protein Hdeb2414_s0027g00687881 [Helianthus debilis subsp. tardiflorus]